MRKHSGAGNMQAQQKAATDDGVVWLCIISFAQLAAGEEVNPAVTRPYGCSVKYR